MRTGEGVNSYIGKEVVLRGEIAGTEDLFLDGTFEGSIMLEDCRLTVGPNARVKANIQARDVVLLGEVTGNIQASGRVELRRSSNLTGDLQSAHLMMEEGALMLGNIELLPPVRQAAIHTLTPADTGLHAVYSETTERKEPQADNENVAVAIASNG
jgi:cytoskeletal protein CcmA (bactofilin family)